MMTYGHILSFFYRIHMWIIPYRDHIYMLQAKLESGQIRNLPRQNWNSNSARSKSEF
jgi:hypothetical protein